MTGYEVIAYYSLIIGGFIVFLYVVMSWIKAKKSNKKLDKTLVIVKSCLLQYHITLLMVTLFPTMLFRRSNKLNLIPFQELFLVLKGEEVVEVGYIIRVWIYNILMFVPLGILGIIYCKMKGYKERKVLFYAIGLIIGIECLQYFFVNGRIADINDFLTNICGVILGVVSTRFFYKVCDKRFVICNGTKSKKKIQNC